MATLHSPVEGLNVIEGPISPLLLTAIPVTRHFRRGRVTPPLPGVTGNNKTFSKLAIIIREIKKPVYWRIPNIGLRNP